MQDKEGELLKKVCEKHGVDPQVLKDLFKIEKKHADRNLGKRMGIFNELSERIMDSIK
jgi:hypothetical protein